MKALNLFLQIYKTKKRHSRGRPKGSRKKPFKSSFVVRSHVPKGDVFLFITRFRSSKPNSGQYIASYLNCSNIERIHCLSRLQDIFKRKYITTNRIETDFNSFRSRLYNTRGHRGGYSFNRVMKLMIYHFNREILFGYKNYPLGYSKILESIIRQRECLLPLPNLLQTPNYTYSKRA